MTRSLLSGYSERREQQDHFNEPPGTPRRGYNPHPSLGTPVAVFQVNMMGMTPSRDGNGFMEAPMHSSSMMDLPQARLQEVDEETSDEDNHHEDHQARANSQAHRSNAFGGHSHRGSQQAFALLGPTPKNDTGRKLLPAPPPQPSIGFPKRARPSTQLQTSRGARDEPAQPTRIPPAGSFPQPRPSHQTTSPSLGKQIPSHTSHTMKKTKSGFGQPPAQVTDQQEGRNNRQTPGASQSFNTPRSSQPANFHRQSVSMERPMTEGRRQNAAPNPTSPQVDDSLDGGSDDESEVPPNSFHSFDNSESAVFNTFQGGHATNYTNIPADFGLDTGFGNTGSSDNVFNDGAFPHDARECDTNHVGARHPQNRATSRTHNRLQSPAEYPPQRQHASHPPARTQSRPRSHTPNGLQGANHEASNVNNDRNSMPPVFTNSSVTPMHNDTAHPTVSPSADETTSTQSQSTSNKSAMVPSAKRKAEEQPREETFAELLAETGGGLLVTPSTVTSGQNADNNKALFLSPTLQDPMSPIHNLSLDTLWSKAQEETRDKEYPETQVWKPAMDNVITNELSTMNDFIKQTIASYNNLKTTCTEVLESKQRLTERRDSNRAKVLARSTDVAHPAKRIRQH